MIIFDARQLTYESNGISNYSKYMLRGLLKNTDEDLMIVLRKKDTPIKTFKNEIIVNGPINQTSILNLINKNNHRSYINNSATFYSPDFVVPFRWCDKRVITLHDVAGFSNAEYHARKMSKIILNIKAHYASKIITVSEFSKSEIVRYLKVKAEKVYVYPCPARLDDKGYCDPKFDFGKFFPVLHSCDYFLFVGTIEPRKNIKLMVESFLRSSQPSKGKKLVIVGKKGWDFDLNGYVEQAQSDSVIWLQNVDDREKGALIKNCAAFCYFSLYEGFGMPVLEALSLGCLVLTSNAGSIREYFSNYTIQIDPHKGDEIQNCFERFQDLYQLKTVLLEKYMIDKDKFDGDLITSNIFRHITND